MTTRPGPWAPVPPPRWAPAPRIEAPAGLGDLGELGEPWAATAWHHAMAMASGWAGEPTARSGWGYPPPTAYRVAPRPAPAPVPARMPAQRPAQMPAQRPEPIRRTVPRWLPTPPLGVAPA